MVVPSDGMVMVLADAYVHVSETSFQPLGSPPAGVLNAPVPSKYSVATFDNFGRNPCFAVVALFVVISDVDRFASVIAAPSPPAWSWLSPLVTSPVWVCGEPFMSYV